MSASLRRRLLYHYPVGENLAEHLSTRSNSDTGYRSWRWLAANLALGAVYFGAGRLGLTLAFLNPSASAVWPPTGIALAVLLLWGFRLWPGIFIGAFLVNVTTQGSLATSLAIAAGNTLEGLVAAALVQRFAAGLKAFDQARTIFSFVALGAICSTTISATFGVTSLCLGAFARWQQYWPIWLTWWLGDMTSDLVIAPLLVIWLTGDFPRFKDNQLKRACEAAGLLLVIGLLGYLVFFGKLAFGLREKSFAYLAIPPLLWAAFRFGQLGAVTSAVLLSALAIWGALEGVGPFVSPDRNESLLMLQSFMATITLTGLVLAAVISERQRAQAALQTASDELAEHARNLETTVEERTARLSETNAELEAFSYSLSHDMRAPLRAINSFTQIVLDDEGAKLSPTGIDFLNKVIRASQRLDRLIQDVLAVSRVSRKGIQIEPVDVEKLVQGIIQERLELQAPRAEVVVQSPLMPVLAHEASLTQCLTNLLDNAVKFVPREVAPKVRVWAEERSEIQRMNDNLDPGQLSANAESERRMNPPGNRWVRLWVEDNGIGIEPEAQRRLFQIFHRVHSEDVYEGTGIGLAIVRKAAERMGGQAGVESAPGQGSRFWLQLPASD